MIEGLTEAARGASQFTTVFGFRVGRENSFVSDTAASTPCLCHQQRTDSLHCSFKHVHIVGPACVVLQQQNVPADQLLSCAYQHSAQTPLAPAQTRFQVR
jgi:hypothetical protein